MAENSEISWTDHTFNAWWGCVKVSALCDHCYAETWTNRYGGDFTNRRRFIKSASVNALKWDAEARKTGVRKRVFCMSMGDIFEALPDGHPDKIELDHKRMHAFELMDATDALDWLVLTKRISNVKKMVPARWLEQWPSHVRLGISVGTQKDADRDIPRLLEIDCPNFLSMEPLLERVDLSRWVFDRNSEIRRLVNGPAMLNRDQADTSVGQVKLQWVITGGESGPHARPSHPEWFRLLRDQCLAAGIPFHLKQWGEWVDLEQSPQCATLRENGHNPGFCPIDLNGDPVCAADRDKGEVTVYKFGKHRTGRLLDGKEWTQFPGDSNEAKT